MTHTQLMERAGPRTQVCVQGLGFVGFAMAIAVADVRSEESGQLLFDVTGVELDTVRGRDIVDKINGGVLPITADDAELHAAFARVRQQGNLIATVDESAYESAEIVIVDINLDLKHDGGRAFVDFSGIERSAQTLGQKLPAGSLVLVETTVPPGTCSRVIRPILDAELRERGLPAESIALAHSYERVTPGKGYYHSIKNFWRVYSSDTESGAERAEKFLHAVINTEKFPLTRLKGTVASETGKVLENSYRAVNIAFIEEWGRFAENVGVDLFEVIDAIRMRPTHQNLRQPGFGVGGYCLTKDPLFGDVAARQLFDLDVDFEFSKRAIAVNRDMPQQTVKLVENVFGGKLEGKSVLVVGASYLADVGDLRSSPTIQFVEELVRRGMKVDVHDPLVSEWDVPGSRFLSELPDAADYDCTVLAVRHSKFDAAFVKQKLGEARTVIDANRFLNSIELQHLENGGVSVRSIGRGLN